MKKLFKVVILPSLLFLALGISVIMITTSCEKEPGSKCSECETDADCDAGLKCYTFTTGPKRCAESAGDKCLNL